MTLTDILDEVRELSKNDKLALIEATVQMLRESSNGLPSIAEAVEPYVIEREAMTKAVADINFDEIPDTGLDAVLREHLYSPDPEPHQMLQRGLFRGMNFSEEDFRAAEWHPSEEDLTGV